MANADQDETERRGVDLSAYRIRKTLRWIFREQSISDYGVDAHVETKTKSKPTGRLLGLQIKSGQYYFNERSSDGWTYRPTERHVRYWLAHSLPMYILLVDLDNEEIYWQRLDQFTIQQTGRGAWVVNVPSANTLSNAHSDWEIAANDLAQHAREHYQDNLKVLPPTVRDALALISDSMPEPSALLAAHLARGRSEPRLCILTLLESSPVWLETLGADGWISVANFAANHDLRAEAADAYEKAGHRDESRHDRLFVAAGFNILTINTSKARALFDVAAQSSDTETSLRGQLGVALCERTDEECPVQLPEAISSSLSAVTDDAVIISVRAQQAIQHRDFETAVELWEQAHMLEPLNVNTMTRLAEALMRRGQTPSRQPGDYSRAAQLGIAALTQLHQWSGPTDDTLDVLLRTLAINGDWSATLKYALAPPHGVARPDEATRSSVLFAAAGAANALGKRSLASEIIDQMPAGAHRDFLNMFNLFEAEHATEQRIRAIEAVLLVLGTNEPDLTIECVMLLATMGVDQTDRFDQLVDRGIISAAYRDTVHAVAAAYANPDTGIPLLRAAADTDAVAARHLVSVFMEADRKPDAIIACESASARFHDPKFALLKAEILHDSRRYEDARVTAVELLGEPDLSDTRRRRAHGLLARMAGYADDWPAVERHCEQAIDPDGVDSNSALVWQLAASQINQRAIDRATATIKRYKTYVDTSTDGRIWFIAMQRQPMTVELASEMLTLALRFEADAELSAQLLTAVATLTRDESDARVSQLDNRPALADDLRRKAFEAIHDHVQQHGDQSPIKMIQADSTEELVSEIITRLRHDDRAINDMVEDIRAGKLPLGILATALGRGYAFLVIQRVLGFYLAASASEDELEADLVAAAVADGHDVVVDASSLTTSSLIADFPALRGNFVRLLLPRVSWDDIQRARVEMDGITSSSGSMAWNSVAGGLVLHQPDVGHQVDSLRRLALLETAVRRTEIFMTDTLASFPEFEHRRHGSWLAPVELAKSQNLALWSDDSALRSLARALNVLAFSTLSLQEHLSNKRIESTEESDTTGLEALIDERRKEVQVAFSQHVLEVPIALEDLVAASQKRGFSPNLAHISIGRPAWWIWSAEPWHDLAAILTAVGDFEPGLVNEWRTAAMLGVTELFREDARRTAASLAAMSLLNQTTNAKIAEALQVARGIATRVGATDPRLYLTQSALELGELGLIDSPESTISQFVEFERDH